jgi:cytoskeletal protein CcmA (bactofilin family)
VSTGNDEPMKHMDEMTLLLYVERQLDRERAQEVSLHTQTCANCLALLRTLDRESRLLTRAMLEQDEALPARLQEFRLAVRKSMQWIWGVVLAAAVFGIYALYAGYIEPWQKRLEEAGFGGSSLLSLLFFQGAFWKGWQSMFTLLEVFVLAVIAGFGIFAVRKFVRRGSAMAVMLASLGLLAVLPAPAAATEMRNGDSVTVAKDEKIKGDIYLFGERIRVEGDVDGDVIAFSQDIQISGHVTGDVLAGGQAVRITGPVDGNIRVFANTLTVSGKVGRNLMGWAQHFTLEASGIAGRSLTAFCQFLTIDGHVGGDVLAKNQATTINGTVGGSVNAQGERLAIGNEAQIAGAVEFKGQKEPEVAAGAKLASPVVFKKAERRTDTERGAGYYLWRILWTVAYIVFGLALFGLMPKMGRDAVDSGEQYGAAFGLGVLVFFGVFIAAIIACFTVIGIFVGISALFLWFVMFFAAELVVGTIVGKWVLGRTEEFWPLVLRMVVGLVIVRAITSLPVVDTLAAFFICVWGMGAISLALYRRMQPVLAPNIPSVPMGPTATPLPPQTTVGGI